MESSYRKDFNTALGERLFMLRQSKRMTQEQLGACLGVSGQQVHKYETGENRITPERLQDCAQVLGVSVGYFFGEGGEEGVRRYERAVLQVAAEVIRLPEDARKDFFRLARTVNRLCRNDNLPAEEVVD